MVAAGIIANLCIHILTWNVGTHYPDDTTNLNDALSLNGTSACPDQRLPDIYVIAMQEVNTKPKNQILAIFNDNPWTFKVREYLNAHEYEKIESEQLQGLLIMLFSKREHIPHMKSIESQHTRTGFGGLWGNKGAVSIRMSLYGAGVTFVGAHLAAHDSELKERIADYNQIVDNHHYKTLKYTSIFDHDFVFWFGDLNFRLTGDDSAWDVRNAIERGQLEQLYERDQLNLVRETGNAFSVLQEERPTFPPTFKFYEGTSDYNLKRRPAWCDRILHRVQSNKYPDITLNITHLAYRSHPEYVLSDHKPVSAQFLYTIESQTKTDDEVYELTHSEAATETPFASVTILSIIAIFTINF